MSPLIFVIVIVAIVFILGILLYNSLVTSREQTEEAWSDITVQLKRRYDLIPNLVNAVKGYAKHEKAVFENVTKARNQAMAANGVKETSDAENQFEGALKSLFAVAEAYPELKADSNFRSLQEELVDSEDKIQAARRFYNGAVRDLNIKIKVFPTSILAGVFGFKPREFFEVENLGQIEEPVAVEF